MLHKVTRALGLAVCGWLLACDAGALTVGRARGDVLVGRPLELSTPVTLDSPTSDSPCPGADVFYGESRVPGEPALRWEPGTGGQGVLRLVSPAPVDEPTITVYLRVGCGGQSTTRRIVMLAEVPSQAEPAARAATAVVQAPAAAPSGGDAAPAQRQAAPRASPRASLRARQPGPAQARLKHEPLDLSVDRNPVLKVSPELRTAVVDDPRRRQEAAALWAVLQKGADQILQEALRLQAVQSEIAKLQQAQQQDAASLAQMRAQLEQARSDRSLSTVIFSVLTVVLLALLAWLGWRWYTGMRMSRVGRWFEEHGETATAVPSVIPPAAADAPEAAAPGSNATVVLASSAAAASAAGAAPRAPAFGRSRTGEFMASRGGSMRMVGVDELIDVHDKADFFLSIGEYDQAIAVLESHVHDQVETSALAWLDLLELYHSLDRRSDYERLRREFGERFTAHVPDFDQFAHAGPPLENYTRALGRIVALWPAPRVLDVIEESIFGTPEVAGAEPFSLEAYRELVLLYHIAKDILSEDTGSSRPGAFHDTRVHPLNASERADATVDDRDLLLIPPASARLGVDIDLGDLGANAMGGEGTRDVPPLDFEFDTDDLPGQDGERRSG